MYGGALYTEKRHASCFTVYVVYAFILFQRMYIHILHQQH